MVNQEILPDRDASGESTGEASLRARAEAAREGMGAFPEKHTPPEKGS